jgi:hypothetical protein
MKQKNILLLVLFEVLPYYYILPVTSLKRICERKKRRWLPKGVDPALGYFTANSTY